MNIKLKPIGGATWILKIDDLKIACDPVLAPKGTVQDYGWFKSKRLEEPVFEEEDFKDVDLWLLTHNHEDHLDNIGLSKIEKSSKIIIHKNLTKKLPDYQVSVLNHGEKVNINIKEFRITIEAIPAIHGVIPISAFFAGGVNGYWLTITKETKSVQVYVSGDTVYKPKVVNAIKGRKADLFIPNMGGASKGTWLGTLTMTTKMLNKFQKIIKPKITLPVHFGTFSHYNEPISETEKLNDETIIILKAGELFERNI